MENKKSFWSEIYVPLFSDDIVDEETVLLFEHSAESSWARLILFLK